MLEGEGVQRRRCSGPFPRIGREQDWKGGLCRRVVPQKADVLPFVIKFPPESGERRSRVQEVHERGVSTHEGEDREVVLL